VIPARVIPAPNLDLVIKEALIPSLMVAPRIDKEIIGLSITVMIVD
jgi:hypothetical protein